MKQVDDLNTISREFYERARFKLALSLIFAAIGEQKLSKRENTRRGEWVLALYSSRRFHVYRIYRQYAPRLNTYAYTHTH